MLFRRRARKKFGLRWYVANVNWNRRWLGLYTRLPKLEATVWAVTWSSRPFLPKLELSIFDNLLLNVLRHLRKNLLGAATG